MDESKQTLARGNNVNKKFSSCGRGKKKGQIGLKIKKPLKSAQLQKILKVSTQQNKTKNPL